MRNVKIKKKTPSIRIEDGAELVDYGNSPFLRDLDAKIRANLAKQNRNPGDLTPQEYAKEIAKILG
jgi:hypothetical protein